MTNFSAIFYWIVGAIPVLASAETTSVDWRTECSGHLQFSLPSSAVAAGMSYEFFREHLTEPSNAMKFSFPDGKRAGWSKAEFESPILISNELSANQIADIKKIFLLSKASLKKMIKETLSNEEQQTAVADVINMPGRSSAWSVGSSVRMFVPMDRHILMMRVDEREKGIDASIALAKKLADGIIYRPLFGVPAGRGICIPNAYIRNDNDEIRDIATSYSLSTRPDVTIWLQDVGAAKYENKVRERNAQSDRVVENFWAQYEISPTVKKVHPLKSQSNVYLAGRKGVSSLVNITRRDGSVDFGYFASVRGDVVKNDVPDINVYIITQSSDAKIKNMVPINESDFMKIVKMVTESIQLRVFN